MRRERNRAFVQRARHALRHCHDLNDYVDVGRAPRDRPDFAADVRSGAGAPACTGRLPRCHRSLRHHCARRLATRHQSGDAPRQGPRLPKNRWRRLPGDGVLDVPGRIDAARQLRQRSFRREHRVRRPHTGHRIARYSCIVIVVYLSLNFSLRLLDLQRWEPFALSIFFVVCTLLASMAWSRRCDRGMPMP